MIKLTLHIADDLGGAKMRKCRDADILRKVRKSDNKQRENSESLAEFRRQFREYQHAKKTHYSGSKSVCRPYFDAFRLPERKQGS